jgi:hypothetical protein
MRAPAVSIPLRDSASSIKPGLLAADAPTATLPASKKFRLDTIFRGKTLFWILAFLLFLVAGLWNRYSDARGRVAAATADRLAQEEEWATVAHTLQKANALRSKLETERTVAARILADRAKPRLSSVLHHVVPLMGEKIELTEISARVETEEWGSEEARIRGFASGGEPRLIADRYREGIEGRLEGNADQHPVTARFELLEDLPGALGEQDRAEFVVLIAPASAELASAATEGR